MAVTATTVAAATTMLAAVAAVFLAFVLCFYLFLCAKRYRAEGGGGGGAAGWLRFMLGGGGRGGGRGADGGGGASEWCYEGGLDEKSIAKLPRREVAKGEALDCAVCITELAAGEAARVLPRCGHAFHVDCVDMWLQSHSTCPLCRCPAVDEPPVPPAVPTPVADPESPIFPTNVLFFGSQDEVSTGRAQHHHSAPAVTPWPAQEQAAEVEAAPARGGLRRLLGCGGASPPPQPLHHQHQHHLYGDADGDIEMGLAAAAAIGEGSVSRPVKPPQPGS